MEQTVKCGSEKCGKTKVEFGVLNIEELRQVELKALGITGKWFCSKDCLRRYRFKNPGEYVTAEEALKMVYER
jgi:hypothetical protein